MPPRQPRGDHSLTPCPAAEALGASLPRPSSEALASSGRRPSELHAVGWGYNRQAASELNSTYVRHEAKREQSERRACCLIDLSISLAFQIHLRHRNALHEPFSGYFQQPRCFNVRVRKRSHPHRADFSSSPPPSTWKSVLMEQKS